MGVGLRRLLQILARLALQIVVHAPVDMFDVARDAEDSFTAVAHLRPHRAALTRAMHDPVREPAQWHHGAALEGRSLRQTAETGSDPAAVKLRELLGLYE